VDGTLSGTIRLEGQGASDGRLRRIVYRDQKRALASYISEILGEMSERVVVQRVTHRRPDDFTGDMWIQIEYEMPQYAMPVGDGFEFKPPMVGAVKDHPYIFRSGSIDLPEERETDIFLYYTQRLDITERIQLPRGYDLAHPPAFEAMEKTYAAFEGVMEQKGRTLYLHTVTDIRRRQVPPSGYSDLREAIDALDEYAGTTIRISKGGA